MTPSCDDRALLVAIKGALSNQTTSKCKINNVSDDPQKDLFKVQVAIKTYQA